MKDFPVFVEVELTNYCNLRCIMCPYTIMTRPKGYMSESTFRKAMKECRGKVKNTYLHQIGEPLLHPKLIQFIELSHDSGIHTSISTNAMLLDEARALNIIESKLDEIVVCLDGVEKETVEKIRPGSDLSKISYNLMHLINTKRDLVRGPEIVLQIIVMNENRNEIERFKAIWEHKLEGIGRVWIKGYSTFAGKVAKDEIVKPMKDTCSKTSTHLTVQWNGDVVPCCRDYNGSMVMGNVNYNTLEDIWHSDKYNKFRENFKETDLCRGC